MLKLKVNFERTLPKRLTSIAHRQTACALKATSTNAQKHYVETSEKHAVVMVSYTLF